MLVNFTKMHSLGNDFVIIDLITQSVKLHSAHIKRLADRNLGIGCDQVITIEPPIREKADFYYRIFNADGQEVEQCGNGARCAAKFFIESGLTNKDSLKADCLAGAIELNMNDDNEISAKLALANFSEIVTHKLPFDDGPKEVHSISIGNPHGICFVKDPISIPIAKWGRRISDSDIFPNRANISFVQVIDSSRIRLSVFERGVGPTLACGSGACAATIVSNKIKDTKNNLAVMFQHGELKINYQDELLVMTGPATSVFIGRFRI